MIFLKRFKKYTYCFAYGTVILGDDFYLIDKCTKLNFMVCGYSVHKFGTENNIVTDICYKISGRLCANVAINHDGRITQITLSKAPINKPLRKYIPYLSYYNNVFTIKDINKIVDTKLSFGNVIKGTYETIKYTLAQPMYIKF